MSNSTEDKIKGEATRLKGDVKEGIGKLVGNEKLQAEGKVDQAAGTIEKKVGDVKKVFDK